MKYSLRSLMSLAFSLRDLLWLAVVVTLIFCWRTDRWAWAYTHNLIMIQVEGQKEEIRQLNEKLRDSQAPAPNPPKE